MALKGFESSKQRSRYEDVIKARKEAANKMLAETQAKAGQDLGTLLDYGAKGAGTVIGGVIGASVGAPAQGAMAGYQAGSAVGSVAKGVATGDPEKVASGVVSGASQYAAHKADTPKTENAVSDTPSGVDSSLQLEADADVAAGADILAQMSTEMKNIYDGLTPEMKQEFLRNQAFAQATTEGFSLPGFAGNK